MTRILLIRHCETVDNVSGKLQGFHNDSDFSEEGKLQLKKLIEALKSENISTVYCSDLGRSFKTAQAIAHSHNLEVIQSKDLREFNFGDWGNLPQKDALAKWSEYYDAEKKKGIDRTAIRIPNGENSFDHQKRVMREINKIVNEHPKNTIVIVGHSGTNKVIIGSFENKDPDDFYNILQSNAAINLIETNGKKAKIILLNSTDHLK